MQTSKRFSIVIIDDDNIMREVLKTILMAEGYLVVGESDSGKNAVPLCEKLKPDLLLLDINMPGVNGLQALADVRKLNPAPMVMMVSAEATMEHVKEAIQHGASGFIVKPLNPANVLDRVGSCFKKKR